MSLGEKESEEVRESRRERWEEEVDVETGLLLGMRMERDVGSSAARNGASRIMGTTKSSDGWTLGCPPGPSAPSKKQQFFPSPVSASLFQQSHLQSLGQGAVVVQDGWHTGGQRLDQNLSSPSNSYGTEWNLISPHGALPHEKLWAVRVEPHRLWWGSKGMNTGNVLSIKPGTEPLNATHHHHHRC